MTTTSNTSFARASATLEDGLRTASQPQLAAYLASVDAADASAVGNAVAGGLSRASQLVASSGGMLADILTRLDATVPTPGGLGEAAAPAFAAALRPAVAALQQRESTAYADVLAASGPVRTLYEDELAALGITLNIPPQPGAGRPISSFCRNARDSQDVGRIRRVCGCDELFEIYGVNSTLTDGCPPPNGPVDPNDKLADSDLLCEFGTVTVDGEPETRCVRYFVPRARATEPVAYTVHFENLPAATANAEFVTITDEIDPAFDINSLQVESTSSDSTFSYSVSGRTITFRFVGIDLPPNVTAPEGEGFVRFTLRPNAGLPDGTEIRNDADIVFDFNPPIATPEVLHEIRTVSDLSALVTAPDAIEVGMPLSVDIVVANLRGDPAEESSVTIQTGGLPGVTATTTLGTCTGAGPIVCEFGTLEQGALAEVTLTAPAPPVGQFTISAATATTAFDGFAANDTDLIEVSITPVGTEGDPNDLREVTLALPRPNPARGATTLRWGLPAAGRADVRVYDLLGREVARLVDDQPAEAGWHETRWDAQVASGVYIVRLRAGDEMRTRRLVVVR